MSDLLTRTIPWILAVVVSAIYHFASGNEYKTLTMTIIPTLIGVICCQLGNGIGEGIREGIRNRSLPSKK